MNELERIVAVTREEVARRREAVPVEALERIVGERGGARAAERAGARGAERAGARGERSFERALAAPGLSLIAEHKRRSPSAGVIRDGARLQDVVGAYERGGAAALSILTNAPSFGGSLDDLHMARASSALPILRKDFIIDPYQIPESLAADADAILLIVSALSERELLELHELAHARGLTALVEVHDRDELELAAAAGARVIGINNRNLSTLGVDVNRTFELLPFVPDGVLVVAESGFSERAQLDELAGAGVDAVLIGEALMRSADIESACRAMTF